MPILGTIVREGANKPTCLGNCSCITLITYIYVGISTWIKACCSRRVPNVNSGSIFEVLNKEYRLLDHVLRVFQNLLLEVIGHISLRLFEVSTFLKSRALFDDFSERLSLSRLIRTFLARSSYIRVNNSIRRLPDALFYNDSKSSFSTDNGVIYYGVLNI